MYGKSWNILKYPAKFRFIRVASIVKVKFKNFSTPKQRNKRSSGEVELSFIGYDELQKFDLSFLEKQKRNTEIWKGVDPLRFQRRKTIFGRITCEPQCSKSPRAFPFPHRLTQIPQRATHQNDKLLSSQTRKKKPRRASRCIYFRIILFPATPRMDNGTNISYVSRIDNEKLVYFAIR